MVPTSNGVLPSERNSSLIEQFRAVTRANEEKAQKMLETCNWNLAMAINMLVDSDYQGNACVEPPINGVEEDIRAPTPQSRAVLVEEDVGVRGRKRRHHKVFDTFRDFQAEAQIQEQSALRENSEQSKKRRTLEDLYRPPLDLMHRGIFSSARDFDQMSNERLMGNIQDSEFSYQVLNKNVWNNRDVKKLISQHKPEKIPYFALLDLRTGEKLVTGHHVDSSKLCELVGNILKEHRTPDGSSTSVSSPSASSSLLDQSEAKQLRAEIEASNEESNLATIILSDSDSDFEVIDFATKSTISSANVYSDSNESELVGNILKEDCTPDGSSTSVRNPSASSSLLDQSEEEQVRSEIEASNKESNLTTILHSDCDSGFETIDFDTKSAISSANMYSDHSNDTIDVLGISESNECELIENFLKEHCTPVGSKFFVRNHFAWSSLLDQSEKQQLRAEIEASVKEGNLTTFMLSDSDSDFETFDSDTESTGGKISTISSANVYSDYSSNDTIDVAEISQSNERDPGQAGSSRRDFLGAKENPKSDLVLRLPNSKREQVTWPCITEVASLKSGTFQFNTSY